MAESPPDPSTDQVEAVFVEEAMVGESLKHGVVVVIFPDYNTFAFSPDAARKIGHQMIQRADAIDKSKHEPPAQPS